MHIVTITALDKTFVDSVVIRLPKISFSGGVTAIAEIGLRPSEEMLRLFGVVRRMAV
jgi:hypothetical protein